MMNTCPEVEEYVTKVAEYIIANRGDMKCPQGNLEELKDLLRGRALNTSLVTFTDDAGLIQGYVFGYANFKKKLFHVSSIITTHKQALPKFLETFDVLFPGYKLAGTRYGKEIEYKSVNRMQRLLKKKK